MSSRFHRYFLSLVVLLAFSLSCQKSDDSSSSQDSQPQGQHQPPKVESQPKEVVIQKPPRKNSASQIAKPYVLMISIDGFRYDYMEKFEPKTLQAWAKEGVRAEGLVPSFPTLTFPNHISLITGRRAGRHGIVGNTFFDEIRQAFYSIAKPETVNDGSWYRGEPIWTVAEKNGMLSGICFWVGSEAKIGGVDPTYFKPFDEKVSNAQRVDWVMEWLRLPEDQRPHFLGLYFDVVDTAGHRYGPDSEQTKTAVLDVDRELARLKEFIDKSGLQVEVIVVSDHGMRNVDSTLDLSALPNLMAMLNSGRGPVVSFYSNDDEQVEKALEELKQVPGDNFKVYKGSELPEEWAMDDVARRGDIVVVGDPGVYVGFKREGDKGGPGTSNKATHGWDVARDQQLQGVFIASGPSIKKGLTIPAFDNTHVYPLVLNILKLRSSESHDGDLKVLKPILKK